LRADAGQIKQTVRCVLKPIEHPATAVIDATLPFSLRPIDGLTFKQTAAADGRQ
jgi:hypothetical protein